MSTSSKSFIAGDWGTSNLRLYLCSIANDQTPIIHETRHGPGALDASGRFEQVFFELVSDWFSSHGLMPVILSGAVSSNIGWQELAYATCPILASDIAALGVNFTKRGVDFRIVTGLKTINKLNQPDVMRGEELQLLGYAEKHSQNFDSAMVVLPGTHNKWVMFDGGEIVQFNSAFTGELFSLLEKQSLLIDKATPTMNDDAFLSGVEAVLGSPDSTFLHTLFSTRSRQLAGTMADNEASSYLSGILIAADVVGANQIYKMREQILQVSIIGAPNLSRLYRRVLSKIGITADIEDVDVVSAYGFAAVYRNLESLGHNT